MMYSLTSSTCVIVFFKKHNNTTIHAYITILPLQALAHQRAFLNKTIAGISNFKLVLMRKQQRKKYKYMALYLVEGVF